MPFKRTLLSDDEFVEIEEVDVDILEMSVYQDPKPYDVRRNFSFVAPGNVAARIGRTIALHVQREDWRQAYQTLRAAQLEIVDEAHQAAAMSRMSPERRAAETPISQLPLLRDRELDLLESHDYETVADLLLTPENDWRRINKFSPRLIARLKRSLTKAGFCPSK